MTEWSDLFRETIKLFVKLILGAIGLLVSLYLTYVIFCYLLISRVQ